MRDRGVFLGAIVALHLLAGPVAAQDASAARGQVFASAVCARCHAVRAHGVSPMHEAPPFRTLAKRFPVDDLSDVLVEGVERRHPATPDFRLAPGEAADLTAYIKALGS